MMNQTHSSQAARYLGPLLIRDILIPYLVYLIGYKFGLDPLIALALGGAWSLLMILYSAIQKQHLDILALFMLVVILIGIFASFISGDPRFSVAKDSIFTGAAGLAFLGYLRAKHSLMFSVCRSFVTKGEPKGVTHWNNLWDHSIAFKKAIHRLDLVWGMALLAEAFVRIIFAFFLPLQRAIALSPMLAIFTIVGLMLWTGTQAKVIRSIEHGHKN